MPDQLLKGLSYSFGQLYAAYSFNPLHLPDLSRHNSKPIIDYHFHSHTHGHVNGNTLDARYVQYF
jgi:hypothetical protein